MTNEVWQLIEKVDLETRSEIFSHLNLDLQKEIA